jgi:Fur family transcriptional regulator, stress-responsive regulator
VEMEAATAVLRGAGLRVTASRLAVLGALGRHAHLTADTITTSVRKRLGAVSAQAVYDNLEVLLVAGLVRRIKPAGSPARFELRVGDNHHHLVCRGCGLVVDTDCAVGDPPCLTPSDSNGFAIDEAEVIYWGRCPDCSAATSS